MDKNSQYKKETEKEAIDKNRIRLNFSGAFKYDLFSSYHNLMLKRTMESIRLYIAENNSLSLSMLDAGCGTGESLLLFNKLLSELNASNNKILFKYFGLDFANGLLSIAATKKRQIEQIEIGIEKRSGFGLVCGDIECMPFKKKKFDIIISNMTLHWLDDISIFLNLAATTLKDDGEVILSFLIEGTLKELADCIYEIQKEGSKNEFQVNNFPIIGDIYDNIEKQGFLVRESDIIEYTERDKNCLNILKNINNIGAKNSVNLKPMSPGQLRRLLKKYETSYKDADGKIFATYKIIYLVLEKKE